jgi:hypothetical protein
VLDYFYHVVLLSKGSALFVAGFLINIDSDNRLIKLRSSSKSGYKIPRGKINGQASLDGLKMSMISID